MRGAETRVYTLVRVSIYKVRKKERERFCIQRERRETEHVEAGRDKLEKNAESAIGRGEREREKEREA